MVNFTMLVHSRPKLTEQALKSIGDDSQLKKLIYCHRTDPETTTVVGRWAANARDVALQFDYDEIGTGPVRNNAIRRSEAVFGRGDYLYCSDNDVCFTDPRWLEHLIEAYEKAWEYGYAIVGAYNHPFNGPSENKLNWIHYAGHSVYPVFALASQSMLMRWSVWDEFGPFCQTPAGKVCQSEDVDFSNRIREAGYKVGVISPWLLANTGITNSFGEPIPGWELVKSQAPEGILVE